MAQYDIVISGDRVFFWDNHVASGDAAAEGPAHILIQDGKIVGVIRINHESSSSAATGSSDGTPSKKRGRSASGKSAVAAAASSALLESTAPASKKHIIVRAPKVVFPGLVDSHVHLNEPGRTPWEGFTTGTLGAIAGGTTTLADMPLNSIPPTLSPAAARTKALAATQGGPSGHSQLWCDLSLLGGLVPGNQADAAEMVRLGAVVGFKSFMCESGVAEFTFVSPAEMRKHAESLHQVCKEIEPRPPVPYMVHAEILDGSTTPSSNAHSHGSPHKQDPADYKTFLSSRPASCEEAAITEVIKICRAVRHPFHIVHLSAASALPLLKAAHTEGLPLTAETCPHYLAIASEDIPHGDTFHKVCPPIRDHGNQSLLWAALLDGTIGLVVSDHSPCTADLKLREEGNFMKAWGGIGAMQFRLPVLWTEAVHHHPEVSLKHLVKWLCSSPAQLIGLYPTKGSIRQGADADICIWNPEDEFVANEEVCLHKNPAGNPFLRGKKLQGRICSVYLRGSLVYDVDSLKDPRSSPAKGKLLTTIPVSR